MFQRLAKVLVLLAAVQLLGGHWVALQSAAWVGMVISYSQDDSLTGALGKTFDGEHPCELCKVVKKGQSEEQKHEISKTLVKLQAVLTTTIQVPVRQCGDWCFSVVEQHARARSLTPPTPPPTLS